MVKHKISGTLRLVILTVILITSSCKEDKKDDDLIVPIISSYEDSVPYSVLGSGKLVFNRIGPPENAYNRFCVIDIDEHKAWRIDPGLAMDPSVSPEGDKIAYSKWGTDQTLYDIFVIDIDGKNETNVSSLAGQEFTPSWTFDGSRVLYSRSCYYSNLNDIEALYSQSPVSQPDDRVQVIDYNQIDPPSLGFGKGIASSSVDGKLALLQIGLRTFDEDGTNMNLILPTDPDSDHWIYSPAWSPSGDKIAYLSLKWNSDISVVIFDPDGANPDTLVSLSCTGDTEWMGVSNQISLCWSPDGSKIAFTRPDGVNVGSHIYIIRTDHTGLQKVTFADGVSDMSISWSN